MEEIQKVVKDAAVFGAMAAVAAGVATFGGRFVSEFPKLSYTNVLWAGTGFAVSALVFGRLGKYDYIGDRAMFFGIISGGFALSVAANKFWAGKELSLFSNAVVPTLSVLFIESLLCFDKL